MTALAVSGLLPEGIHISRGFIRFGGRTWLSCPGGSGRPQRQPHRHRFQDAMAALNPTMRVGRQIAEVLKIHTDVSAAERRERTLKTMADVGLEQPERLMRRSA